MADITIDELAAQAGIKDINLDQQCFNDDLLLLYNLCDPWELIGQHLKLTHPQISAVDGDNKTIDEKRLGVLQKWKETFAHKATYRVLLTALLACGKAEQALEVCKILAQEKTGNYVHDLAIKLDSIGISESEIQAIVITMLLIFHAYSANYQQESLSNSLSSVEKPSHRIKVAPIADGASLAEEDIFTPHKSGHQIVEMCVQKLKSPLFNVPDDNEFMKRVAYVMSEFGKNMIKNGGIWQVTPTVFEDTMDTSAHKRLPRKYQQIWKAFNIDWKSVKYKDLDKPFYSALAARLYLSNYPEYIPPSHRVQDQAEYWKFRYMTGSGDIQHFIEKVKELEQVHP